MQSRFGRAASTWLTGICFLLLTQAFGRPVSGQITVQHNIPPVATIRVDAERVVVPSVPRTLFGTFLEPIGNSTYNGLWAQILENPSLEEGLWSATKVDQMLRERPELRRSSDLAIPIPWEALDERQGNRYEIVSGSAANSWQALRVFAVPGEPTGIRQRVYLPVHRILNYTGSLYARHLRGSSSLTVSIRLRNSGEVLASQKIEAAEPSWQKYTFQLHVPEGKLHRLEPADFVVELDGDEAVDLDQLSLDPADAISGLDPDALELARRMHTPLVRFGGNYTSSYHWKDGIGPADKRVSMRNISWGIPEYNTFGTDEFLEFCRLIGAQPQIALNLGSGSPQEAADWVRYVNEHWTIHSGLLWEMGNELWGNWNLAYPTKSQLAARTVDFSRAIRAVDPAARLIATGGDPEVFNEWNGIQLTTPSGSFDYLSTHFVVGTNNVRLSHPSSDFAAAAALALPVELERRLRKEQAQIDLVPGYKTKAHIAFTEWLFLGDSRGAPGFNNAGGALITGGFLNMLLRNSSIVPISDMTGIMEFAGIWKKRSQVFATPAYYVFRMYSTANTGRIVSTAADAGSYSVSHGIDRLPEIADVPYLDVVSSVSGDGKVLTLFCVNRSLTVDIPARIHLEHFQPAKRASVQVLASSALSDANDEVNPAAIQPIESSVEVSGQDWTHTFQHSSVTVISVNRN